MHKPALAVLLALILQITSAEPEADPQFGHAFVANRLGSPSQQGCQNVAPLPRNACAGKTSSCWSPGVRDTDCPGHGLCCFDGCINVCLGQAAPFVAPVPPPLPPPVVPISKNIIPISPPHSPFNVLVKRNTRIPKNPCQPSPCGPGTLCTVNNLGNAICNCQPGLIPKPDTITGCGPECTQDPECYRGQVCLNQRCVDEPDPCNPSPCGPGTTCTANKAGGRFSNPICRCQPGLIPNPDTITGCKPECVIDPDCQYGYVCQSQRCIEKPDPCDPSPCGPGARCMNDGNGNAICRCEPGLVPKPDTITGCGPECVIDPDCPGDYVCEQQKCSPRPDPCDPSPCGPGAICTVGPSGNPICRCEPGLIPNPDTITGCKPECIIDPDCPGRDYICQNQKCVLKPDPCDPSPCGPGTMCMTNKLGNPICRCLAGLVPKPDTITGCGPECQIDPDCSAGYICQNQKCIEAPDPCVTNPCGTNAICTPKGFDDRTCKCPPGHFGDPNVNCIKGECQHDDDCTDQEACENYYCINPCKDMPCQKDYFCKAIRHIAACGKQFVPVPQEPREVFVIGESYKPGKEQISSRGSAPSNNFVIGSRHTGGSSTGHSSRSQTSGSPRSSSASVIGATYRRRRHLPATLPFIFQF